MTTRQSAVYMNRSFGLYCLSYEGSKSVFIMLIPKCCLIFISLGHEKKIPCFMGRRISWVGSVGQDIFFFFQYFFLSGGKNDSPKKTKISKKNLTCFFFFFLRKILETYSQLFSKVFSQIFFDSG